MAGYWIARSIIKNPEEYRKYTDELPAIFEKFGAKVLSRGGNYKIMEGPEKFERFVLLEFETMEQAVACFESDEYNAAASHRRGEAGEVETVIIETTAGLGAGA